MRTATHLQLFRFKCVAFVQQKYHNSISSSRGFCRFFERKCKKIKISRSENVSQAQQVHPRYRKFVTSVLHFTVFRNCFVTLNVLHFIFLHLFCNVFHAFSVCLFIYMHISKCNRLLCALFRSTPLPQPFSGLQPAFGCTFCNKKQHRQPFQGHLCCAVFLI